MAGFGAVAVKSKPKNKKKKNGSKQASFDVNASISRLEKKYDELMLASAKKIARDDEDPRWASADANEDKITSEFVVAARSQSKRGVDDWVPIAQICIAYPESEYQPESKEILESSISSYCRELSHVASFGAPIFSTVARSDIEYSAEPTDSFHKFVYDAVVEEGDNKTMSKKAAREILELDDKSSDRSEIKKAYRSLSFKLHPDRISGKDSDESSTNFEQVQLAYETLTSGIREENKSWYESLGHRSRTDFHKIILSSLTDAKRKLKEKNISAAMIGLDPDLVQSFVARNLRSE
jgi:hypothetical protein